MDTLIVILLVTNFVAAVSAVNCPDKCHCDLARDEVKCTGLGLTDVPQNLSNSTRILDLNNNAISALSKSDLEKYPFLQSLDLGKNKLETVENDTFTSATLLKRLNLSQNSLKELNTDHLMSLIELDLSDNSISELRVPASVKNLNLSGNLILNVTKIVLKRSVSNLDLSRNQFSIIPAYAFFATPRLEILRINEEPHLYHINVTAFTNLRSLHTLEINQNRKLSFIHVNLFANLTRLRSLDLSYNNITSFYLDAYQSLYLDKIGIHGNPLLCNCALKWLLNKWKTVLKPHLALCSTPESLQTRKLFSLKPENLTCILPRILNYTERAFFRVGSQAVLKCIADGEPEPLVKWTIPSGRVFIHNNYLEDQWNTHPSKETVLDQLYHLNGEMQAISHKYVEDLGPTRIQLLSNGDLFISYVLRTDAGPYRCHVRNPGGNETQTFMFLLNYTIIKDVTVASMIVGFSSAGIFFGFGLLVALVRYLGNKCAERHRKRSKKIKKIIGHLDTYRSQQILRLRENYGGHYGKIKEHLISQMDKMRENYFSQIARVQEKCAMRMDNLRDNYGTQMGKIKGYSGQQIDKVKDNYNNQMIKIRDYGSTQLEKLRETYKLQHQHLMKILETMNMDNCRGMVDNECMRANSVLFDTKFTLANMDLNLEDLRLDDIDIDLSKNSSRNSLCISEDFLTACSDPDGISVIDYTAGVKEMIEANGGLEALQRVANGMLLEAPDELDVRQPLTAGVHKTIKTSPNLRVHRAANDLDEEPSEDAIFVVNVDDTDSIGPVPESTVLDLGIDSTKV